MKNKNIKNKPKNVVDGFSCILDFLEDSRTTPYKGNISTKPSKSFFNNNSSQRGGGKLESPPPLNQTTRNLSLGYTVPPPFKTLITLLPVTFSQLDVGKYFGSYLLTDALNCLTVKYLAGSHLE